ncbi:MAG: ribosomal protein S12 methylthiotransferase RimO [Chitinophagales bacterium]|nr:MAG: ribosomal protein S12 methylthiotransferase RimO [Chitinophagales bacterium]
MKTKPAQRINIITLGCAKNLVDSEELLTQLRANHLDATHEAEGPAPIVVINTCGFIETARQESINTILEYAEAKRSGWVDKIFVTGCLSHRYKDDLSREIPEVDGWFGTGELSRLLNEIGTDYKRELIGERLLTTPGHYAYLKISEGCNRTCSFCAIPLMRGRHVSKPLEQVVQEAKNLVNSGVKEILLIAQELTYYGLDLYRERRLPALLTELEQIDGLEWIRLHYAYPSKFPLELLSVMKQSRKICRYLDLPLQHISDSMLLKMKRGITKSETLDLIHTIRDIVPDIALRTTLMVGFPGETEADFDELREFVQQVRFDRLGVFTYSHEEGTAAFHFKDNVLPIVKKRRAAQLMALQEEIAFDLNQRKVGSILKVLFDRVEGDFLVGRTEFDSPEIDNEVLVNATGCFIRPGDFAQVKITHAEAFDLYAEPVDNFPKAPFL